MGLLDFLGLNKGKATTKAADQNAALIDELAPVGQAYLDANKQTTGDYLALGQQGANTYADAVGLNGADGSARATEAFQTGPGYDFTLNQGLDAVMRRNSALGRLQSGNTDADLTQYATGLADQTYNGWLDRLSGYNDMYTTGVGMDTGANGALTDWASGITTAQMGANNQRASGKEAGQGAGLDLLSSIAGIGGNFFGYGGFGGQKSTPIGSRVTGG